jgi:hypothetical protein
MSELGLDLTTVERRETIRYEVHALVEFRWVGEEGTPRWGRGVTRDICSKGMFIYSDSPPAAKDDLEIEVSFRTVAEVPTDLQMAARAVVLRTETATTPGVSQGFAVLNKSFKLHRSGTS